MPPHSTRPLATDEDIARTAQALKAMSHPLRLKILCSLAEHERSVGEIVDRVGTTQSNVSQHLRRLQQCGLLHARHHANVTCYRIGNADLLPLIEMMRAIYCVPSTAGGNGS